ncbi:MULTISPECIES: hypothetical protein [unclassified Xanthomonas]|uniref:hypothetical protein n=1 Tax=Xanthomonas TaxID=338 RepID=UPI000CEF110D|nr:MULTISPECIES: hypothetical protein [unclassified Xanthomonas]PPU37236.1 hypothetical protein XspCFBP7912_03695 [Xanthomonas sp. CFBP 7912]RJS02176.1 hypothetical protein XnspCFBP7698_19350 [Xanthomonas sp. CFBP 7698]
MFYDTQETPALAARAITHDVGLIASTLECRHAVWLSLMPRHESTGGAIYQFTCTDDDAATAAFDAISAQVRR